MLKKGHRTIRKQRVKITKPFNPEKVESYKLVPVKATPSVKGAYTKEFRG